MTQAALAVKLYLKVFYNRQQNQEVSIENKWSGPASQPEIPSGIVPRRAIDKEQRACEAIIRARYYSGLTCGELVVMLAGAFRVRYRPLGESQPVSNRRVKLHCACGTTCDGAKT